MSRPRASASAPPLWPWSVYVLVGREINAQGWEARYGRPTGLPPLRTLRITDAPIGRLALRNLLDTTPAEQVAIVVLRPDTDGLDQHSEVFPLLYRLRRAGATELNVRTRCAWCMGPVTLADESITLDVSVFCGHCKDRGPELFG